QAWSYNAFFIPEGFTLSDTGLLSGVVSEPDLFRFDLSIDTIEGSVTGWLEVHGLKDTDVDGIPDEWETANGLNAVDPSDALADEDGDGFTAGMEYIAG